MSGRFGLNVFMGSHSSDTATTTYITTIGFSLTAGMFYYNTAENLFRMYNGTIWKTINYGQEHWKNSTTTSSTTGTTLINHLTIGDFDWDGGYYLIQAGCEVSHNNGNSEIRVQLYESNDGVYRDYNPCFIFTAGSYVNVAFNCIVNPRSGRADLNIRFARIDSGTAYCKNGSIYVKRIY